jgi:hypothetical protein
METRELRGTPVPFVRCDRCGEPLPVPAIRADPDDDRYVLVTEALCRCRFIQVPRMEG